MTDMSYVGDGETMPTTPDEALGLLSGFMDGSPSAEGREDIDAAFTILNKFIEKWSKHDCEDIIPWGDPGDCWDRIANDPDIYEALKPFGLDPRDGGSDENEVMAKVIELGLGEHYGNPHCIWCLQAD